MNLNHLVIS